jgi:hypothetical protein
MGCAVRDRLVILSAMTISRSRSRCGRNWIRGAVIAAASLGWLAGGVSGASTVDDDILCEPEGFTAAGESARPPVDHVVGVSAQDARWFLLGNQDAQT